MATHLLFVFLSIALLLLQLPPCSSSPSFRTHLMRTNSRRSDYARQLARSKQRLSVLRSRATGRRPADTARMDLWMGNGDYAMPLAIGTPPVRYWADVDTGSDLIWTRCKPCAQCNNNSAPLFDPAESSSFTRVARSDPLCRYMLGDNPSNATECDYFYEYLGREYTSGYLASEAFTIGDVAVPHLTFGCGTKNDFYFGDTAGMVGLSPGGNLSLVNQLSVSKFSYCLTSDETKTSSLLFGAASDRLKQSSIVQSTPLLIGGTLYYATLQGISLGGRRVPIPNGTFDMKPDGSGGTLFDTGTTFTYLESEGYKQVNKAFLSQMKYPVADNSGSYWLDLCFEVGAGRNITVPGMTLHLDGADMDLPVENYFEQVDTKSGTWCLTVLPTTGFSIVGNIMQMNMHIQYDLENSVISFHPMDCSLACTNAVVYISLYLLVIIGFYCGFNV